MQPNLSTRTASFVQFLVVAAHLHAGDAHAAELFKLTPPLESFVALRQV